MEPRESSTSGQRAASIGVEERPERRLDRHARTGDVDLEAAPVDVGGGEALVALDVSDAARSAQRVAERTDPERAQRHAVHEDRLGTERDRGRATRAAR